MDAHILQPQTQQGLIARKESYDIRRGKIVFYGIVGYRFALVIDREGIALQGSSPVMGRDGAEAIQAILRKAVVHHEHLASTPVGEAQTILTEEEVEKRLAFGPLNQPRLAVQ